MPEPDVAIVHDYLTQRGGAERVALSMLKAFPDAPFFTSLYEPDSTYPEFLNYDIRPMWTNRLGLLRTHHRRGLFLYPAAFSSLRVDAKVVLCSSSAFAHGVRTAGRKVVYCYTPSRWLYSEAATYMAGWGAPLGQVVGMATPLLRRWDRRAARTADRYLTTSTVVQRRIRDTYGIDARLVPPSASRPVTGMERPPADVEPGFILCVSRLLAYKNVEAVIAAFALLPGQRLVVVGEGPELAHLRAKAGPAVTMRGRVDDAELAWLYLNCAGLIAASHEDFGLTPLEAASCGKPVVALRAGGFLDTVIDGQTGLFFDQPDAPSIAAAVRSMLARTWNEELILAHADTYSEESFIARLRSAIGDS